jgi:hypothetical protein
LSALFPRIRTVIADAGHESRKLARTLKQHQGWQLRIVKRRQRAFKITGLTWIVERSFAWLGRNRRLSKERVSGANLRVDDRPCLNPPYAKPDRRCMRLFKHPFSEMPFEYGLAKSFFIEKPPHYAMPNQRRRSPLGARFLHQASMCNASFFIPRGHSRSTRKRAPSPFADGSYTRLIWITVNLPPKIKLFVLSTHNCVP